MWYGQQDLTPFLFYDISPGAGHVEHNRNLADHDDSVEHRA